MNLAPVPGVKLTKEELAYLVLHEASKAGVASQAAIGTGIGWIESGEGFTNVYRPEAENPLGGQDTGLMQINSKAWKYDPLALLDPLFNLKCTFEMYKKVGVGWGPWNYGPNAYGPRIPPPTGPRPARTDASIKLVEAQAAVAAAKNPYWKMKDADMNVGDLPVPPKGLYLTYLPAAPLRYGQSSATSKDVGDRIHRLQDILKEYGFFIGTTDYYYGGRVRDGLKQVQQVLKDCGLWVGAIDGAYTETLYRIWDGALKANHIFQGR